MSNEIKLAEPMPFNITFHDGGEEVGKFYLENDKLVFTGHAEASAKIFAAFVIEEFEAWESRRGG